MKAISIDRRLDMNEELVAIILAGGRGTRLQSLTKKSAKPAVFFGGKYRIIDFPLSNCANSDIKVVGIATQYESTTLNNYIGTGKNWGLNGNGALTSILPPRETPKGASWYLGTADAIYQNIDWLDKTHCQYVCILSGDHIYKMDYSNMLNFHKAHDADVTIACIEVDINEASRFGIMVTDDDERIVEFQEKPKKPKSTLASMGIYIFSYPLLRKALISDSENDSSSHDFGKDILPKLLSSDKRLFAYHFDGYWKDVGTVNSLWQANMDLLDRDCALRLYSSKNKIFSIDTCSRPQYIGISAEVKDSIINQGAIIYGKVTHSVISNEVKIEKGAQVIDSFLMPGAVVKENVKVENAIIGAEEIVDKDKIGSKEEILLVSSN